MHDNNKDKVLRNLGNIFKMSTFFANIVNDF